MAGHSKWAYPKHRKAAQDAKRGKIFTKIIRELATAPKLGGGDPDSNPRLRAAMDQALSNNMTRDTMNRAIARGVGGDDDTNMETIIYEGYGPGGTAVMIECLSDNRNRTVAEVRHAFTKCGGNLGTDGSVAYLFTKKGVITYAPGLDEDSVMEAALEAGAEDIVTYDDGAIDVFTAWESLGAVKDALTAAGFEAEAAEVSMIPSTKADMDAETAPKLLRLIDMLEDCDDVQEVYHNGEISDEVAATLRRSNKTLTVEPEALEKIVTEGYSLAYGARFLKRVIDDRIKLPLSQRWKEANSFRATMRDDQLVLEAVGPRLIASSDPEAVAV